MGDRVDSPATPQTRPAPAGLMDARPNGLWAERFDLIDGWRGLAALAVVVHHVTGRILIGGPAVLLFFVISGYCIAASADSCQRRGLGFGTFMLRRVRRIYPPYLLSIAFWAATRTLKWSMTGENDLARPVTHWIQNVTLTQWLSMLTDPLPAASTNRTLFVAAYWSLCYEEQFYLIIGLLMLVNRAAGVSVRSLVSAIIVVGLVWNVIFPEMACGFFIEYWAIFGFGVLVYHRLCRLSNPLHRRIVDVSLILAAAGAAYLRWFAGIAWQIDSPELTVLEQAETRMVYEELFIGAAFALFLIAIRPLSRTISSRTLYKPLAALGHITFSLYLIHQFNLTLARSVVEKGLRLIHALPPRGPGEPEVWYSLVLQIAVHIGMASVFWYLCERPFLNKSLPPVPAPSAPSGKTAPPPGSA